MSGCPTWSTPHNSAAGCNTSVTPRPEKGRAAMSVSAALFVWACVDDDAQWARETGISAVSAAYHQDFAPLADRYLLIGTPQSVTARLAEFASAGVESVLLQLAAGNREDRRRIIESIAEMTSDDGLL